MTDTAFPPPFTDMPPDPCGDQARLSDLNSALIAYRNDSGWRILSEDQPAPDGAIPVATLSPCPPELLGSGRFRERYNLRLAYAAGAMANGIASVRMVERLANEGLLASYGAGGVNTPQVEQAVRTLRRSLGERRFAVNVIHSPHEMQMEQDCVDICLRHEVPVVEASAYMRLTPPIVQYRCAGVQGHADGSVTSRNRIIAKVSRAEVASQFLAPPPEAILESLVNAGRLTPQQARLAARLPMADDITVEADSGGHTDRRPLLCLLPAIQALRDEAQQQHRYAQHIGVGAAGGIGTGPAAAAAFSLGADYVVTGSVNQACMESGTSDVVRSLLAKADITDVDMAPAADMFEMGVQLQVLRRGTMFPMRARQLYQLYQTYDSIEAIPATTRERLEKQIFRRGLDQVWQETVAFFEQRDPSQIAAAIDDPRRRMALVFRSYLGQSSLWANQGVPDRSMDYQIWASPAIGAFNRWVQGSYLETPAERGVVDVAIHIMRAAAFQTRLQQLRLQGVELPVGMARYAIERINGD